MRSIQEIYDLIILEKESMNSLSGLQPAQDNAQSLLSQLTSNSKVAIWRLWAYVTAVVIYSHEVLFDIFRKEVQEIADAAPSGTPKWYRKKCFEFQYGDDLEYLDDVYKYAAIDDTKRITQFCAIEERPDGVVVVKVAKSGPEPFVTAEKDAIRSYLQKIKFAGTRIAVVSTDGDVLTLNYTIYYDPIIPLATLQQSLELAMNEHLKNLPFNGAFNLTKFTDTLQTVTGVVDPVYVDSSNTPDGGASTGFGVEVIPASGWFQFSGNPADMFTFEQKI